MPRRSSPRSAEPASIDSITSACGSLSLGASPGASPDASAIDIVTMIREHFGATGENRNVFVRHSGSHYETISSKGTVAEIPMTALIEEKHTVEELDDDDDDGARRAREPVDLPSWQPPTSADFREMMRRMDDVQILRHGLQVVWYARLHQLAAAGLTERARNLTSQRLLDSVMHPGEVPQPGQCLPSKLWANNCTPRMHSNHAGHTLHGAAIRALPWSKLPWQMSMDWWQICSTSTSS